MSSICGPRCKSIAVPVGFTIVLAGVGASAGVCSSWCWGLAPEQGAGICAAAYGSASAINFGARAFVRYHQCQYPKALQAIAGAGSFFAASGVGYGISAAMGSPLGSYSTALGFTATGAAISTLHLTSLGWLAMYAGDHCEARWYELLEDEESMAISKGTGPNYLSQAPADGLMVREEGSIQIPLGEVISNPV